MKQIQKNLSANYVLEKILTACILAPLAEEFLYRGFLYPAVKKYTQPFVAAVVVSGLFAVAHGFAAGLLPLFVMGLLLILAYELTGAILVPILIHAGFNLFNVLYTVYRANAV